MAEWNEGEWEDVDANMSTMALAESIEFKINRFWDAKKQTHVYGMAFKLEGYIEVAEAKDKDDALPWEQFEQTNHKRTQLVHERS
jgi:hypothetical protein